MSWRGLLRTAALGQSAGLLTAAAVLGDGEAAAIGVLTFVAFALLRVRSGRLGAGLLALLFADTAFFTSVAAVTNLLDRAPAVASIGPGLLATVALVGLPAAVITLRLGRGASRSTVLVGTTSAIVVALFLALAAASAVTALPAKAADDGVLTLDIKNVRYSARTLQAKDGKITVRVTNHDLFWHTFTIDELGISLIVPVGGERDITFTAPPGVFEYYCGVPGHRAQMNGALTVSH